VWQQHWDERGTIIVRIGHPDDHPTTHALTERRVVFVLAGLLLFALLPFALVRLPTMTDLFDHVGRFHVMLDAGRSPWLARFYRFDWHVVGNLGGDLIVAVIGPVLGVEPAARAMVALVPLLTIAGVAAVSRAVHGRVQPSAVVAACFVFGNPFHFGFVNYCLSLGLALLVFAVWVRMAERSLVLRSLVLTPLVLLVWVAHAMGWAVLALLVAGFEGTRLVQRGNGAPALRQVSAMVLAFVPPVVLTLSWRQGGGGALFSYGDTSELIERKVMTWVTILRGGDPVLDIGVPILLLLAVCVLLWRRSLVIDPRMAAGGVLLSIACTVMPATIFSSWAADERIAPAAAIALALSLRSRGRARDAWALVLLAAALFVVRTAEMTWRWYEADHRYAHALTALDLVPRGARISAMVLDDACHTGWAANGWSHLPGLAIVRRDALVNSQWPLVGAPLLRVIYPAPAKWVHDPSQHVPAFGCETPGLSALHRRIAATPHAYFDYLWVLNTRGARDPWPGRDPLYRDANSALFRLSVQ
jgi:hypothetical protein